MTTTTDERPTQANRATGILLGLACGDALGRPVEFTSHHHIASEYGTLTEMVGDGTHGKPAGTVTDDTELAICIARSLATQEAFDPADISSRFIAWHESDPFDAGMMTVDAIRQLKQDESWRTAGKRVWDRRPEGQNAGNGSVMRCAPYAIAFANTPETVLEVSRLSSRLTHADPRCTYGCAILNRTLAGLITGEPDPLQTAITAVADEAPDELLTALRGIPADIPRGNLQSTGYVIHTLQSALYHGLTADHPRAGIAEAATMGQDTDTVAAVTGAILGARFGATRLPTDWVSALRVETESHSPETGHREWVQRWHEASLEATLRTLANDLTVIRERGGFQVQAAVDRSEGVSVDE